LGAGTDVRAAGDKIQSAWFRHAQEEASFYEGVEVSPPHPPLKGEGGRRKEDVVDGSSESNSYVYKDYTQNSIDYILKFILKREQN